MKLFERVSRDEFAALIKNAPGSPAFKKQFKRFRPSDYDGWEGPDHQVYRGSLVLSENFTAPGFNTLILGSLHVDGYVDLQNPYDKGFDEGGLFIVLGDVRCRYFLNEYGKYTFIDGTLEGSEAVVADYGDSSLIVTGDLLTSFYYGMDVCAKVGGKADMTYGCGYCLPIDCSDVEAEVLWPRHGELASRRLLAFEYTRGTCSLDFKKRIRKGEAVFRK